MASSTSTAQSEALQRANLYQASKPASNSWKDRTVDIGNGQRLYLSSSGTVATTEADIRDIDQKGDPNRNALLLRALAGMSSSNAQRRIPLTNYLATQKSAEDLNRYLSENNAQLAPGEGTAVIGFRPVTLEDRGNHITRDVPIYGRVSSSQSAGSPAAPAAPPPRPGTTPRDQESAAQRAAAEDTLYGRSASGARPQLATNVPLGGGTDSVADFRNGQSRYNQIYGAAMATRADNDARNQGRWLQYAASSLPAVPKTGNANDLFTMIREINATKLFT